MSDLVEQIENFIQKSESEINKGNIPTCSCGSKNITHSGSRRGTQCHECGRGFKDTPVKKGVASTLLHMKRSPSSSKVIIPSKLNYNPVTLQRVSKQLTDFVNKMSTQYGDRIYLARGEKAPEGAQVFTGSQGGKYYVKGSYKDPKQDKTKRAVERLVGSTFTKPSYEASELSEAQKSQLHTVCTYRNKEGEETHWDCRIPDGRLITVFND